MHARARQLIDLLGLEGHPEGGYYREVFRSLHGVQPDDARGERSALTTIFFLLAAGQRSWWHRFNSDEAWHFHEGDPLELFWLDDAGSLHCATLGALSDGYEPVAVVPAGRWQAARPLGAYALVGCSVGPGFAFEDFELLDPDSDDARILDRFEALPDDLRRGDAGDAPDR